MAEINPATQRAKIRSFGQGLVATLLINKKVGTLVQIQLYIAKEKILTAARQCRYRPIQTEIDIAEW